MEFLQFLVKAKINTYATGGEGGEISLGEGGKKLSFNEENFSYTDVYYGYNPFSGKEIIKENWKIIWVMNYYGATNQNLILTARIYSFLQRALKLISEDIPFRGPAKFKEGYFEYINEVQGDAKEFVGEEKIFFKGKEVYKLLYHGGFVKGK